uniref:Uncharacterized protein n=1 Tax=Strigamia maritima TaxID=126957 RepID=T1JEA5_STRMM
MSNLDEQPAPKRRKLELNWSEMKVFPNYPDARQAIKDERMWSMRRKTETYSGDKIYYECKFSKYCLAKRCLHLKADSDDVVLLFTTEDHTHEPKAPRGIPRETKDKIRELYRNGVIKPKFILRKIQEAGLPEPKSKQVENFLYTVRAEMSLVNWKIEQEIKDDVKSEIKISDGVPVVVKSEVKKSDGIPIVENVVKSEVKISDGVVEEICSVSFMADGVGLGVGKRKRGRPRTKNQKASLVP